MHYRWQLLPPFENCRYKIVSLILHTCNHKDRFAAASDHSAATSLFLRLQKLEGVVRRQDHFCSKNASAFLFFFTPPPFRVMDKDARGIKALCVLFCTYSKLTPPEQKKYFLSVHFFFSCKTSFYFCSSKVKLTPEKARLSLQTQFAASKRSLCTGSSSLSLSLFFFFLLFFLLPQILNSAAAILEWKHRRPVIMHVQRSRSAV